MPILKYRTRTLSPISALIPEISYVMCGARGETSNRFMRALPQMKFFGFEPDPEEHARLSAHSTPRFTYFQAAVGGRDERCTLYVTRNPAGSSLLRPNQQLYNQFQDCGPAVEVVREVAVDVVSLDSFLPEHGVPGVDFLNLDAQGSELEILRGAENFLSANIVGVQCEVEFSPLYQDQPLFGELDAYLRSFGFVLFDLSRTRYRRNNFPRRALTRGQLLWGDAVYLRDRAWLVERSRKLTLLKLCLLAALLQFHDYALEILDCVLTGKAGALTAGEQTAVAAGREQYMQDLARSARWTEILHGLEAVGLKRPLKLAGRLSAQVGERLRKDRSMTEYNWTD